MAASRTGFKDCASNAADTGGDDDGYEINPGNGCAQDGSTAADINTGTKNSTSCTDAGKDRHRFWGYAFGLPGSVSSVNGISVQLRPSSQQQRRHEPDLRPAVVGRRGHLDGDQVVSASPTAMTTYTLGSATDTWGQDAGRWRSSNTTNFRVRVIDVPR